MLGTAWSFAFREGSEECDLDAPGCSVHNDLHLMQQLELNGLDRREDARGP
jgi:hypothetical protein